MNILITGANGLIGSHLINLLQEDHYIYAIVRDQKNIKFNINKRTKVLELDLSTNFSFKIEDKIDCILYLAQSKMFRLFPEECLDVVMVNVLSAVKFAKWAIDNNVKKFIYASTGGVFTNIALKDLPVKENSVINANEKIGFYASSKLSAEMLLRNFSDFFETFAIIRPFFVYGPGQDKSMLIPRLIQSIISSNEIILNGDNGIRLNPIYVTDAVKAISNILDLKGEYIFNISGEEIVTLKELCFLIKEIINKEPIFKIVTDSQYDLIGDNTLMKKMLTIPTVSLYEGLKKLIEVDFYEKK